VFVCVEGRFKISKNLKSEATPHLSYLFRDVSHLLCEVGAQVRSVEEDDVDVSRDGEAVQDVVDAETRAAVVVKLRHHAESNGVDEWMDGWMDGWMEGGREGGRECGWQQHVLARHRKENINRSSIQLMHDPRANTDVLLVQGHGAKILKGRSIVVVATIPTKRASLARV